MAHNATQPPLPDYDQALQTILMHAPRLRTERVALSEVLGRVLRQDVAADRDQPPFDRSAMDGFAVRSESFDRATCYTVIGTGAAGAPIGTFDAAADQVVRIATGAPVPAGFDAVVPIEQADVQCNGDAERVRFRVESCQPWKNVHRCASDATRGQVVLRAGTRLAPHHIGIAAAVGATQLDVAERPRICVLTSGDEVQPTEVAADQLEPQQIRNSNGPMLASFFEVLGTPVLDCVHIPDEPEQTLAATREALG
ncbi:MAG: molybdopterin molybdotransferase MoeA, partial [Phycisphaeraceae bacterium]